MPAINNAAGRLHAILTEAKKNGAGSPLRQVWGNIFGIDPSDTPRILSLIIDLMGLVEHSRKSVETLQDVDTEIYLKPIIDVESAFTRTNLDTNWGQFNNHITDSTMTGLAFCSDTLARSMGEEIIEQAVLDELKADVEAMIDEILKAPIEPSLKAVIVDHLESIRQAIIQYKIRGTQGLKQALDSGIGSLLRHGEDLKKPENQSWVSRLTGLFIKIDTYISVGIAARRLFGHVTEFLQLGR